MNNIVFVVPSMRSGGLERVASVLANIGSNNHKITIISLSSTESFYEVSDETSLLLCPSEITRLNRISRFLRTGFWLRRCVKEIKPQSLCSFGERYSPFVLIFMLGLKFPKYVTNRASPLSSLKGWRGFINPLTYKLADGILLQTSKSYDLLKTRYDLRKYEVIGNPVDLHYTNENRSPIVLNVGSIGGNKNQDLLIKYFQSVLEKINDPWILQFIGDGPKMNYIQELSKTLGLSRQVEFLGVIKNPKHFYSKSSIFAFTSTSEGFPNALAEAMAAGCACIAYDCIAGPSDIIDDGLNGFLIPMGNEEMYVEKLSLLMTDSDLRERFSQAAKEKMKQFEASEISERFFRFITTEP